MALSMTEHRGPSSARTTCPCSCADTLTRTAHGARHFQLPHTRFARHDCNKLRDGDCLRPCTSTPWRRMSKTSWRCQVALRCLTNTANTQCMPLQDSDAQCGWLVCGMQVNRAEEQAAGGQHLRLACRWAIAFQLFQSPQRIAHEEAEEVFTAMTTIWMTHSREVRLGCVKWG